jgi:hypothetical protein
MRFRIQAPAIATVGTRQIRAFTRDISTHAVHFRTAGDEASSQIGEALEFVIRIPPSMSFSKPCVIKGRGRTVRLDKLEGNESGLIVEILDYDIERESTRSNPHQPAGDE